MISVVKRTGIVSNRLSDIILSGHSCDINIILDMHASTENKSVDKKDCFYEELERVFNQFCKYPATLLSGDCNAKIGRKRFSARLLATRECMKIAMI